MFTLARPKVKMRPRRLILLDVENLNAGARLTPEGAADLKDRLSAAAELTTKDQVVVSTRAHNLMVVGTTWPKARYVIPVRRPEATPALVAVLSEDLDRKYTHVVLASGDGRLAPAVATLRQRGVHTRVITRLEALSHHLELAADQVTHFRPGPPSHLYSKAA